VILNDLERGTLKTRELKSRHQNAGVEIAGVEIATPKCRGGNRGRRKSMKSEGFKNVFLTILTENRVMILAAEQVSFASIGNKAHMTEKQHTMR